MYGNLMRLVNDVILTTANVKGEPRSVLNNRVAIKVKDKTTFIDIVAWGSLAEVIGAYLAKGDEFYGEGELRNAAYKIKLPEGTEKEIQAVYLLLDEIQFTHGNKRNKSEIKEEPGEIQ
ncbi:single-stranded DNA-binding protein [Sinanaerobacter sp. ZZT-01]|uniref:single-stranded DNA-binding protein n=1 Tax=Sinanaerobacter sp. ZZT-01 TaxID=3111540 RepID=UPI002D76CD70|nr:single-stranded DNA-binding protein [Sinanaerobacter sp. ZZT-01]WRR94235.1 single-stranded DNA-binding protein [Sinanaerobacter sp. ZZT-01]